MCTQVFDYYMPFALMGDSAAQYEIAEIWRLHYKCKSLAYYWYCQSARGGHHKAAMAAAFMALASPPPDYASALKWANLAIEGDMVGARLVQSIVRRHAANVQRQKAHPSL
jgi:TPR repeat protein